MNGVTGVQDSGIWRTAATRTAEAVRERAREESADLSTAKLQKDNEQFQLSTRRPLTEEEKNRLEQLKNELAMLLAKGDETTAQDERRLKEIAKEMEKLTGIEVPVKTSISDAVEKLKKTDGKDEDDKKQHGSAGMDPTAFSIEMRMREMALPYDLETPGEGLMTWLQRAANSACRVRCRGREQCRNRRIGGAFYQDLTRRLFVALEDVQHLVARGVPGRDDACGHAQGHRAQKGGNNQHRFQDQGKEAQEVQGQAQDHGPEYAKRSAHTGQKPGLGQKLSHDGLARGPHGPAHADLQPPGANKQHHHRPDAKPPNSE
jgi:hypothetical protein